MARQEFGIRLASLHSVPGRKLHDELLGVAWDESARRLELRERTHASMRNVLGRRTSGGQPIAGVIGTARSVGTVVISVVAPWSLLRSAARMLALAGAMRQADDPIQ